MNLVFGLHRSPQSVHLNGRWSDLPKKFFLFKALAKWAFYPNVEADGY